MFTSEKTEPVRTDAAPGSIPATTCLNCGETVSSKFCPACGQSANTRRFSPRYPLGTASQGGSVFDIPILYTLRELLARPGHAVRDILQGKRLRFARVSSMLVIFLIVDNFIQNYSGFQFNDLYQQGDDIAASLFNLRKTNPKLFLLATIPLQAVFSYLIFMGSRLNYLEHLYLNGYRNIGQLLISILFSTVTVFTRDTTVLIGLNTFLLIPRLAYDFWFYSQLFSTNNFSRFSRILRSALATVALIGVFTAVTMMLQ